MPIATIQENSGVVTTPAMSCVVSLPSGTTAGNTLLVFLTSQSGVGEPAGFVLDKFLAVNLYAYRKSEVAASETSWTFTTTVNSVFAWYVVELSGVDEVEPLDTSAVSGAGFGATSNGGTRSTGTAPLNAALDTVVYGAFAAEQVAGSTESWSGYTNGFDEVADVSANVNGARQLAVASKAVTGTTGTFETTATLATSQASTPTGALLVAYRAANSPIAAPLAHLAGFEWGTHGGIHSHTGSTNMLGSASNSAAGTWGTNYLIQAASARTSGYGLQVVQSGAAAYVYVGNLATPQAGSFGLNVRVVSATGTVVVASLLHTALGAVAQLLYDASASKFGVQCGTTGTTSWQSGTTATNTWVWVDLRVRTNTSTWRAEWRLETAADTYTDQAAAELTGQSATVVDRWRLGANAAQTVTADFDDLVMSRHYVAYPLGPHQIRLLTVDPAGTPTVSGTSSNFSVFTANGTLAAWNAANARDAVDEVPPTVSASADGVCQTAVAASDYMEFPMAAATLAADEVIDGVRMLAPAWGGTGTGTGTLGLRGWDGTTETTLIPASTSYDAGAPTAVSATEPRWQCALWQWPTGGWTKTRLDGASLRVGFSTDATPDMGCDALYLEYATRKARADTVVGESGGVVAEANLNPNTAGTRSATVDTPADQGATMFWDNAGTPGSQVLGVSDTHTEVFDAPDGSTIVEVGVSSDADAPERG